jgi:nucleotide-binding universal stress UspA family protein
MVNHCEPRRSGHRCPVKEVPGVGRIVVGVDGSPNARRALAWAAAEAHLRQAGLQVVHAYHAKNLAAPVYFGSQHTWDASVGSAGEPQPELTASVHGREAFEEAVRSQADELLEALLGELGETVSGVEVQRTVVEDRHPAEALVALSVDADLLVVGSRGRGGFSELLLGSVSHAAVLHAACPVVVVPSARQDETRPR